MQLSRNIIIKLVMNKFGVNHVNLYIIPVTPNMYFLNVHNYLLIFLNMSRLCELLIYEFEPKEIRKKSKIVILLLTYCISDFPQHNCVHSDEETLASCTNAKQHCRLLSRNNATSNFCPSAIISA